MRIIVLGSGSNGAVPQWDCPCPNCARARADPGLRRTRSSVAVSTGGGGYVLIDASPDLKQQLESVGLVPKSLETGRYERQNPIRSVLLTHGHGDHCVGLFEFSTGKCFQIPVFGPPDLIRYLFGTADMDRFFRDLGRLARDYVEPRGLRPGARLDLGDLSATGFEVSHTDRLEDGSLFPSITYGYEIEAEDGRFIYTPDLGLLTEGLLDQVHGADLFMLDGTFWWDDELARVSGLGKTSYDLGHVPIEESLRILKDLEIGRVVYTHINHTNPLLDPGQPMAERIKEAGFEVAYDGMVIEL